MAASNTRTEARQMSGPVPSPSMKGMIGWSGTLRRPCEIVILAPPEGGVRVGSVIGFSGRCAARNAAVNAYFLRFPRAAPIAAMTVSLQRFDAPHHGAVLN